jgi:hypothetical protein
MKNKKQSSEFRYGESNPGLAGLMLCLRAADASHYTITDGRKASVCTQEGQWACREFQSSSRYSGFLSSSIGVFVSSSLGLLGYC